MKQVLVSDDFNLMVTPIDLCFRTIMLGEDLEEALAELGHNVTVGVSSPVIAQQV